MAPAAEIKKAEDGSLVAWWSVPWNCYREDFCLIWKSLCFSLYFGWLWLWNTVGFGSFQYGSWSVYTSAPVFQERTCYWKNTLLLFSRLLGFSSSNSFALFRRPEGQIREIKIVNCCTLSVGKPNMFSFLL